MEELNMPWNDRPGVRNDWVFVQEGRGGDYISQQASLENQIVDEGKGSGQMLAEGEMNQIVIEPAIANEVILAQVGASELLAGNDANAMAAQRGTAIPEQEPGKELKKGFAGIGPETPAEQRQRLRERLNEEEMERRVAKGEDPRDVFQRGFAEEAGPLNEANKEPAKGTQRNAQEPTGRPPITGADETPMGPGPTERPAPSRENAARPPLTLEEVMRAAEGIIVPQKPLAPENAESAETPAGDEAPPEQKAEPGTETEPESPTEEKQPQADGEFKVVEEYATNLSDQKEVEEQKDAVSEAKEKIKKNKKKQEKDESKDDVRDRYYFNTIEQNGYSYKFAAGELAIPGTVQKHRSQYDQSLVSGGKGDDAGHLLGNRFGAPGGQENLGLQNWRSNRGSYKQLEDHWEAQLRAGVKVEVFVMDMHHEGEERPFNRLVEWSETDSEGNKVNRKVDFANFHTEKSREKQNIPTPTYDQLGSVASLDQRREQKIRFMGRWHTLNQPVKLEPDQPAKPEEP
jgi:hypothetical protein